MMRLERVLLSALLGLGAAMAQDGQAPAEGPVGWASWEGGTTGGAGGEVVTVTSGGELKSHAGSSSPKIIRVSGRVNSGNVTVGSNTTIEGAGPGAEVVGAFTIGGKENIILRNLVVRNGGSSDLVHVTGSHHIWIDHCELIDAGDEILAMTHGCDFTTVSWTKIHYTYDTKGHRYSVLLSASDGHGGEDGGKLNVTFHHNWWADNVQERMPRWRFGKIHVFNSYYSAEGNNYCIGCGKDGQALVENNYFDNVQNPHIFYGGVTSCQIMARGNVYKGVSATTRRDSGQGPSFTPPYAYRLDPGEQVKDIVMAGAGPFKQAPLRVILIYPAAAGHRVRPFDPEVRGFDAAGRLGANFGRAAGIRFRTGRSAGLPLFPAGSASKPAGE